MNLQIDAGNSFIKWRVMDGDYIQSRGMQATQEVMESGLDLTGAVDIIQARMSSVANKALTKHLHNQLLQRFDVQLQLARVSNSAAGVTCGYQSPETLGVDRWLAVVAAYQHYAGAVLVVDAGSAITMDLVGPKGEHLGGYILPGLEMMRQALWQGTEAVQVASADPRDMLVPGDTTQVAVNRGCLLTAIAAIEKLAGQYPATLILTGGDSKMLLEALSLKAEHRPDLVLDGLSVAGVEYSGAVDQ
jgi:type III pantothenate kinase